MKTSTKKNGKSRKLRSNISEYLILYYTTPFFTQFISPMAYTALK